MFNAVDDGIAEVEVGRGHGYFCAQDVFSFGVRTISHLSLRKPESWDMPLNPRK